MFMTYICDNATVKQIHLGKMLTTSQPATAGLQLPFRSRLPRPAARAFGVALRRKVDLWLECVNRILWSSQADVFAEGHDMY